MPGKYYEYLKCGSYVVPVEISFLTSTIIYDEEVISTSKWIERHHWKEIKSLLKPALEACTNTDVFSKSPHIVFGNEVGLGYLIVNDREKFPFLAVLEPKNHCWTDVENEEEEELDQSDETLWRKKRTLTNYPPTKVYIKAAVAKRSSSSTTDTQKLRKALGCGAENDLRNYLEPSSSTGPSSTSHSSTKNKFRKEYLIGHRPRNQSGSSGFGDDNLLRTNSYLNMPRGRVRLAFRRKYPTEDSDGYVEHDLNSGTSSSSDSDDDKDSLPDIPEVDVGPVPFRPTSIATSNNISYGNTKTSPSSPTKTTSQFNGTAKTQPQSTGANAVNRQKNRFFHRDKAVTTSYRRSPSISPIRVDTTRKNNPTTRIPKNRSPDITQIKTKNARIPTKRASRSPVKTKPSGELRELQINEQSNAISPSKPPLTKPILPLLTRSGFTPISKAKPKNTITGKKTPKSKATRTINGKSLGKRKKLPLVQAGSKSVATENVPLELNRPSTTVASKRPVRKRKNTVNKEKEVNEENVINSNKQNQSSTAEPAFLIRKIKEEKDKATSKTLAYECETQRNKDENRNTNNLSDSEEEDLPPIDPEMPKLTPQVPYVPQSLPNSSQAQQGPKTKAQFKNVLLPTLRSSVPVVTKLERFSPPIDVAFKKTNKGKKKAKVVHKSTSTSSIELSKNIQLAPPAKEKAAVVGKSTLISREYIPKETEATTTDSTSTEKEDIFSFAHISSNPTKPNESDIFSAVALMPPPTRPPPRAPRKFVSTFPTATRVPSTDLAVLPSPRSANAVIDKAGTLSHLSTFHLMSSVNALSGGIGILQNTVTAMNANATLLAKKCGVLAGSPEKPKRAVSPDITSLPIKKIRTVEPVKAIKPKSAEKDSQSDEEMEVLVNHEGERLFQEIINRFGNEIDDDKTLEYEPVGDEHDLSQRAISCIRIFPGYSEKSRHFKIHVKKVKEMTFEELMGYYFDLKPILRSIFEGQVPSMRHNVYLEGPISRPKLRKLNVAIPFDNDQSSTLLELLFEFIVPIARDRPQWTDYINYVMLPELLIRIYSTVNDIPCEQAENEMRYGACYDDAPTSVSTRTQ